MRGTAPHDNVEHEGALFGFLTHVVFPARLSGVYVETGPRPEVPALVLPNDKNQRGGGVVNQIASRLLVMCEGARVERCSLSIQHQQRFFAYL